MPKAITPLMSKMSKDQRGSKTASIPNARPRQAFMEWTVGRSIETRYKAGGNMLLGTIMPPKIMEGRKIIWLNRTIERELGETTPINMPMLANVKMVNSNIKTKYPQLTGAFALKKGIAVNVMMMDTMIMCTKLLNTGMVTIESSGTPLILKLRNIPASRDSTTGLGKPSKVHAIIATRIIEGIMVGAKVGLSPVMSKPINT